MRILKRHSLLKPATDYVIDSPQPSNISYWWNIGSLLGLSLMIQIITGVTLAMHYNPNVLEAFNSVEHIMRDVNNGWLIRYLHSNTASAFFFLVYLHIGRGLYYGSYKAPRTLTWTIGTFIFILMMATAFLGYVLPYGQMSLWGIYLPQMHILIVFGIIFITIMNLTTKITYNKLKGSTRIGPHNIDILSIIYGSLLGDAHAEKRLIGSGTRITFYQEGSHLKYILYLHNLFSQLGYCSENIPVIQQRLVKGGKVRKIARFSTWTYTSFNWIRDEWYTNNIKCVPKNLSNYLTPLALAIWIMDDGSKVSKGLKFSTNSFTYSECVNLTNILFNKFDLKCSVQGAGAANQYVIYVWKESMADLRKIVSPYIIPEMKYKLL